MRNMAIAEWILGLVTSRDRAVTIVGDFAEDSASRSAAGFWFAILRTTASLLWRGAAEKPLLLTGAAFAGLAMDTAGSALMGFLGGILLFVGTWNGHQTPLNSQLNSLLNSQWWTITFTGWELVVSLAIGRVLARLAPGRELPACLTYGIVYTASSVAVMAIFPAGLGASALVWVFLSDAAKRIPVLAGAVWGRHRAAGAL